MADDPQSKASPRPLADHYGEHYYANYSHDGQSPYRRGEPAWIGFFGEIARQIVADLRPRTVLDAGCAIGLLVEALRDRGVEAWGVDSSTFAIGQVRHDIRQFCSVGSVADDLEHDYDLITCIEVLEHLPAEVADKAVANFARHTERVLLSSTPADYREPTHLNVQPADYWVGLFARHGMFRDLDFDAYFVSGHAILFRREPGMPLNALRAYERRDQQLAAERRELRAALLAATEAQASQAAEIEHLQTERTLLSGEVNYWEWQQGIAQAALDSAQVELENWRERGRTPEGLTLRNDRAEPTATVASSSTLRQLRERVASYFRQGVPPLRPAAEPTPLAVASASPAHGRPVEPQPGSPPPTHGTLSQRSPTAKRVLFISDGSDGSRRYRCDHQAEALERLGWSAEVIVYADKPLTDQLASHDAFILDRLPLRPNLESLIQLAQQAGKPLIYDTDDLIFDPQFANSWGPFAAMSSEERQSVNHGMWRNGQALRRADAVLVSTEPLRRLAADLHARVSVSPNGVSQAMVDAADAALEPAGRRQGQGAITLAYLSGTATHQADFVQAAEALKWALGEYAQARLLIVGLLDLPADFAPFGDRIERLDLQPWQALPAILARVTINLAPLEPDNVFTEAKSCVKYLEAGLLGVPTIASPRPDFVRVIRHGHNGLLADSPEAWIEALRTLIESGQTRAAVGQRAYQDVRLQHTSTSRGQDLQDLLHELLLARAK